MRLLGIFVSIAVLLGLAVAQADLADILAQIPLCTVCFTSLPRRNLIDTFSANLQFEDSHACTLSID